MEITESKFQNFLDNGPIVIYLLGISLPTKVGGVSRPPPGGLIILAANTHKILVLIYALCELVLDTQSIATNTHAAQIELQDI